MLLLFFPGIDPKLAVNNVRNKLTQLLNIPYYPSCSSISAAIEYFEYCGLRKGSNVLGHKVLVWKFTLSVSNVLHFRKLDLCGDHKEVPSKPESQHYSCVQLVLTALPMLLHGQPTLLTFFYLNKVSILFFLGSII